MPYRIPPNETTLNRIYNCEVAANLLRKYVVSQEKASANTQVWTLINAATAVQSDMANTANWSLLP